MEIRNVNSFLGRLRSVGQIKQKADLKTISMEEKHCGTHFLFRSNSETLRLLNLKFQRSINLED